MIHQKTRRSASGFSLIEILLVLSLVALLAAVVAGNAGAFITGGNAEPPVRVLKRAALDALYFSSEMKREVLLKWNEVNATFLVTKRDGEILQAHPVYQELDDDIRSNGELMPEVIFTAIGPKAGVDGGSTEYEEDDLLLSSVRFHAGCSTPFKQMDLAVSPLDLGALISAHVTKSKSVFDRVSQSMEFFFSRTSKGNR